MLSGVGSMTYGPLMRRQIRAADRVRLLAVDLVYQCTASERPEGVSSKQDGALLALLARWHTRELCAMPDGHNPYESPLDPIEEPKRRHDHFPIRELRELRDDTAGVWKFLQSP